MNDFFGRNRIIMIIGIKILANVPIAIPKTKCNNSIFPSLDAE